MVVVLSYMVVINSLTLKEQEHFYLYLYEEFLIYVVQTACYSKGIRISLKNTNCGKKSHYVAFGMKIRCFNNIVV